MPKYFLPSPAAPFVTLRRKGEVWRAQLYYCERTDTYWILQWNPCGRFELVAFDRNTGRVNSNETYEVPADWDGEPQAVAINNATWCKLQSNREGDQAVRKHIGALLHAGDIVLLVDDEERVAGRVYCNNGTFKIESCIERPHEK
jgi:hypothetical protein